MMLGAHESLVGQSLDGTEHPSASGPPVPQDRTEHCGQVGIKGTRETALAWTCWTP
jgi:hypothetical protein